MMKLATVPFFCFFLISFSSPSFSESCDYVSWVENDSTEDVYNIRDIEFFVDNEIRTRIKRDDDRFMVVIQQDCDGELFNLNIEMETRYLYIKAIDGYELPQDVESYNNRNIALNFKSFEQAYNDSKKFGTLKKRKQRFAVKLFAFIIAESARFEDIYKATGRIFQNSCTYSWGDYRLMVRRWKTLSVYANSRGMVDDQFFFGGGAAILFVPIKSHVISDYNYKAANGWRVVRSSYNFQVTDKELPVNIGNASSCSN